MANMHFLDWLYLGLFIFGLIVIGTIVVLDYQFAGRKDMYVEMNTNPYDIGTEITYVDKARMVLRDFLNDRWEVQTEALRDERPTETFVAAQIDLKDIHAVWFSKTLGNWKAILITTLADEKMYEVTHNGLKRETYVDEYYKISNAVVAD